MTTTLSEGQRFLLIETIDKLGELAYENSAGHGFWDDYKKTLLAIERGDVGNTINLLEKYVLDTKLSKIALIHSELGEMTEGVRKPHPDEHVPEFSSEEIELADALVRIADYAAAFHLRLGEAVLAKMEYNKSRPYKHGKGA